VPPGGYPPHGPDKYLADPGLAADGHSRIQYAERSMPLLGALASRFSVERPLAGLSVAACLHVTAETAVLARVLRAGGAQVSLAASNPLSTQDDVAAALAVRDGVAVFARAGVDRDTYYEHISLALGRGADLVVDDGGDLVSTLHESRPELLERVRGGCENTATGVLRLRRMAAEGALAIPMLAANDTPLVRLTDNTRGTGQSVVDGVIRASGILLAGKTVVVCGFGASGAGIAECARGLGSSVIVTEVDPVRALEAVLRGYRVMPLASAAPEGDVFITATGSTSVIGRRELAVMRDGAILANAGHFDVEIDVRSLDSLAVAVHVNVRPHADAFELADGRRLLLLAEGRVVNLVAADGNPPEVMDVAFGIEALALAWLADGAGAPGNGSSRPDGSGLGGPGLGEPGILAPGVHEVPAGIDAEAARLVLAATGTAIDALTPDQEAYLSSWRLGS
jgi:adenosylhomocysteinase